MMFIAGYLCSSLVVERSDAADFRDLFLAEGSSELVCCKAMSDSGRDVKLGGRDFTFSELVPPPE
jgi:hypothetical protein